ncbi:tetratricopeptide (TPR) repeat protein [Streptomyces sp. PvR006]|uniref:AAA family ATPase n=1 Tax=Streptomyces sp. PvR006 TaxID=2817860 RepID=UPI0027DCD32B|nr:AAA family ATPase [Streptomyces sp. PvR006]MBP2586008.1 tetratricopeptide (TPR) repeat protein [Streptomyces sp. PvR006]
MRTEPGAGPVRGGLLLERGPELAAAARAVEGLVAEPAGGGCVLVYRGEAGRGKTALLAEIGRIAGDRCTVLTARGDETHISVPFHVTRQLLHPALEEREFLHGEGAEAVDRIAPALGLAPPPPPPAAPADPQVVRGGLVRLLDGLAERLRDRPPVLLVDDAQWADAESLAWLDAYTRTRQGGGLPVLVVLAHRPPPPEPSAPSAPGAPGAPAALAALGERAVLTLGLDALTPEATAVLARDALGGHADEPFCHALWTVTSGNAYETVELLAKAREREVDPVAGSVALLRELGTGARGGGLVARLQALGAGPTRLARAIAVLGPDSTPQLLRALTGMAEAELAAHTDRLRRARIVTAAGSPGTPPPSPRAAPAPTPPAPPAHPTPAGPLEFTHPLIATAVYGSVPPATRSALHGRAARALAEAGHAPAAAARHLLAVQPADDEDVVRRLRAAAAEHLAVGAPDAARRCLDRALAEPPGPETYATVLYELGCASLLTAPAATVRHLRSALDLPGLDDILRVDATYRLAQVLAHSNQLGEAAGTVAAEAARTPPGTGRRRLQAAHFMYEGFQAAEEDGPGRSRRLAELTGRLTGADNPERALLAVRAFDATLRGEPAAEVVRLCDSALVDGAPARGLGWTDTTWGFEIPALTGIAYAFADRPDRARALFGEAVRAFEISGWSGAHLAFAHTLLGLAHRRRGDLPRAQHHLEEGLRLADRVGRGLPVHWDTACLLVDTLLARGRTAEARDVADRYAFGPPWPGAIVLPDGPSVLGRLLLAEGRHEEAAHTLEAAAEALTVRGRHHVLWAPWPFDLARALAPTDPDRAARVATEAHAHAERLGTPTARGEALRCLALFAAPAESRRLLTRAVAHLSESPSRYEESRARLDLARATGSATALAEATSLATTCGAVTARASTHPPE